MRPSFCFFTRTEVTIGELSVMFHGSMFFILYLDLVRNHFGFCFSFISNQKKKNDDKKLKMKWLSNKCLNFDWIFQFIKDYIVEVLF